VARQQSVFNIDDHFKIFMNSFDDREKLYVHFTRQKVQYELFLYVISTAVFRVSSIHQIMPTK